AGSVVGARDAGGGKHAFVLYVGDLTLKKNVAFLVRAFDRAGSPERLVLAGRRGDGYAELRATIESAAGRDRIAVVEGPGDAELDGLYREATALALPSRYEGFGFTPLEAMARGCPVLASDIPAVREISGSGALLVPPDDEHAWSEAIRRVTSDERLRSELRRRGEETVARYSWDETARGLCRVWQEAASDGSR
ncbi:MAG: glycosyltransferase family 4 protein, partial [Thermoleophilia bacterium]|nr:glycosyltransferase family 4 protein [Thermoleophilia bacterium]